MAEYEKMMQKQGPFLVRATSARLLLALVGLQLLYFAVMIEQPFIYIFGTLLLGGTMGLVIYLLPDGSSAVTRPDRDIGVWLCNSLPCTIILVALFKFATRSDIYLGSLSGGLIAARDIVAERESSSLLRTAINVFLTPLWINLLVIRTAIPRRHRIATGLALGAVPLIGVLDLVLFGARVTIAYQVAILFVAGLFTIRSALAVGAVFVAGFIYVHASRTSSLYEIGAEYLSLTASGRTLGGIHDLSSVGLPDWWIGFAVFFQYIAHSVGELVDLSRMMPLFHLSLATFADQLAVVGIGSRGQTQATMAQINPGNGAYQTFFGAFLIDFGLAGYAVALIAIAAVVALVNVVSGQVQRVMLLILATNFALAPIENFFVMGAGLINFLLALGIAVVLSMQFENRSIR